MEDYIDVLLQFIGERRMDSRNGQYIAALAREETALEDLSRSLTAEQKALFRAYENARDESAAMAGDDYARQAFLLAREIFR